MFIENEIASAFLYSVDRANDKILNLNMYSTSVKI